MSGDRLAASESANRQADPDLFTGHGASPVHPHHLLEWGVAMERLEVRVDVDEHAPIEPMIEHFPQQRHRAFPSAQEGRQPNAVVGRMVRG